MSKRITTQAEHLERFRHAARKAVSERDDKGTIPSQANIILTYKPLDNKSRLEARTWIVREREAAKVRCQPDRAKAWSQVLARVNAVVEQQR